MGWELRETRKGMQSQFYQARAFQSIEASLYLIDRPEILAAVRKYRREGRAALTVEELDTVRAYAAIEMTDKGNDHYQYVNGYLDEDFYMNDSVPAIHRMAPIWEDLDISPHRASFAEEIARILSDESRDSR